MTSTLLRGRTLSFVRWPQTTDDHSAWRYEEDGGLLIRDGRIVASGTYAQVEKQAGEGTRKIDHRPHLLLPGFIDTGLRAAVDRSSGEGRRWLGRVLASGVTAHSPARNSPCEPPKSPAV